MVDNNLKRPLCKHQGHVIHIAINRFLIYDFLEAVNSNFCSRTHRLATIHNVTDDRRTQQCTISAPADTVG